MTPNDNLTFPESASYVGTHLRVDPVFYNIEENILKLRILGPEEYIQDLQLQAFQGYANVFEIYKGGGNFHGLLLRSKDMILATLPLIRSDPQSFHELFFGFATNDTFSLPHKEHLIPGNYLVMILDQICASCQEIAYAPIRVAKDRAIIYNTQDVLAPGTFNLFQENALSEAFATLVTAGDTLGTWKSSDTNQGSIQIIDPENDTLLSGYIAPGYFFFVKGLNGKVYWGIPDAILKDMHKNDPAKQYIGLSLSYAGKEDLFSLDATNIEAMKLISRYLIQDTPYSPQLFLTERLHTGIYLYEVEDNTQSLVVFSTIQGLFFTGLLNTEDNNIWIGAAHKESER